MAYKINDEIFFLKIDEQVEYLTQVINELYSKDIKIINTNINNLSARINNLNETKQDKTSDELKTEVKNIVGSINELFDKIESETNRAVNSENEISTNLTEYENHVNPILDSHTSSISSINDSIRSLQDNKQSKIDEQLQTTSKEVVGAINENHDAIVTNEALIDTKQDKNDSALETTSKTVVGAINELNKKSTGKLYYHYLLFTQLNTDLSSFTYFYTGFYSYIGEKFTADYMKQHKDDLKWLGSMYFPITSFGRSSISTSLTNQYEYLPFSLKITVSASSIHIYVKMSQISVTNDGTSNYICIPSPIERNYIASLVTDNVIEIK